MRKRIAYSQNFLKDKNLILDLIKRSSITNEDMVYEIGAGQGIITEELLKRSGGVVAYEIDRNLYDKLTQRFQNEKSLELKLGNFLDYPLPNYPYKVFSNIPFNITSAIIKKLTEDKNPPKGAYLIVQKEAAKKFIGKPYDNKNSQIAILLKPLFDITIAYEFERSDFFPKPSVNIILLQIRTRENPLISEEHKILYEDFITYTFNQFKPNIREGLAKVFGNQSIIRLAKELGFSPNAKPSELNFENWLGLFSFFLDKLDNIHQSVVRGSYTRLLEQQDKLEKINRTRTDSNWKHSRK